MNTKFIFQAFVVMILSISQGSAALTSLVSPICRYISETDPTIVNYEYCISAFGLDSRTITSTAPQLAQIAYELSITRAKDIIATIDRLRNLSASDPLVGTALKDCLGAYLSVLSGMEAGVKAIQRGDINTASASATAAMNAANTCGSGIRTINDKRGNIGPLTKAATDFYQLSAITLSFTKLLRIIN